MTLEAWHNMAKEPLEAIYNEMAELTALSLTEIDRSDTALIIVDMIGGFVYEGALYSPRNESLLPKIENLLKKVRHMSVLAVCDSHEEDSPEFASYPQHCLAGTAESALAPCLTPYVSTIFQKGSTNAIHAKNFSNWLLKNPKFEHFVIVGVCTDICVKQLAISLKTYFNEQGVAKDIIVPAELTETYTLGPHNAELYQVLALSEMKSNGVNVVRDIV